MRGGVEDGMTLIKSECDPSDGSYRALLVLVMDKDLHKYNFSLLLDVQYLFLTKH